TEIKYNEISTAEGVLLGFKPNTHSKPHHTAGYIVTRNDGARYIYGEALYNTHKEEVTFAVEGRAHNNATGIVTYSSALLDNTLKNDLGDKYYDRIITGPYAHTYLLTCLLSSDYSDADNIPGPSEKDFGSYTLFKYSDPEIYNWRTPCGSNTANYNEGLTTDSEDDKGSYIYGKKEQKYLERIETKTHIAIFYTSDRDDALGVVGENGQVSNSQRVQKLDRIALYSKGEYYLPGTTTPDPNAVPIKEAHFEYDYSLCPGVPNSVNGGGKLTLKRVFFTYRNSEMGRYSDYEFTYGDVNHDGFTELERNPSYNLKGYDIWGNYKPNNGTTNTNPL
ncbi:MAG: hypothetical protein JNJ99_10700, partial [Crocinitomicaceae bacterium]|nr:hypothetical protein [Crocinitomicaceae bacterium]